MPKFCVHVYAVKGMAEVSVDASNKSEAVAAALDLKDKLEYGKPDCNYISIALAATPQPKDVSSEAAGNP